MFYSDAASSTNPTGSNNPAPGGSAAPDYIHVPAMQTPHHFNIPRIYTNAPWDGNFNIIDVGWSEVPVTLRVNTCFFNIFFTVLGTFFLSQEGMDSSQIDSDIEYLYRRGNWYCRISRQVPYRSQTKRQMSPQEVSLWLNVWRLIDNV